MIRWLKNNIVKLKRYSMKSIWYFILKLKYDLIATIIAVIIAYIAYHFSTDQQLVMYLTIAIAFILFVVIIYLRIKEKDFYFISMTDKRHERFWIGRGYFQYV